MLMTRKPKLDESDERKIVELRGAGLRLARIAERLGISEKQVGRVLQQYLRCNGPEAEAEAEQSPKPRLRSSKVSDEGEPDKV